MSFRAKLLAEGTEEAVSVNQRALVEKILARYSGEYTVYRELLQARFLPFFSFLCGMAYPFHYARQNSDDAGASSVELHFRTSTGSVGSSATTTDQPTYPSDVLPDLLTAKIATVMVRNDGFVFRQEDWARLQEIASGNPDETKIGAFGVGFYSLFSLCDEPVVSSGNKVILFYWKNGGDQLFVRSAIDDAGLTNVSSAGKPWSTFLTELREPQPMPEPNDFARFLSSCLGFTSNLSTLSLFFDGHLLFRVTKSLAPSRPIALKPQLASISPLKILRLKSVEEAPFQLRAEVSNWMLRYAVKPKPTVAALASSAATTTSSFASKMLAAFSKSSSFSTPASSASPTPAPSSPTPATKDPLSHLTVTLFLRTVAGTLTVSPSSHFNAEMMRATKKALPSTTKYSLIWTTKHEFDASHRTMYEKDDSEAEARRVFSGLMTPDLSQQGRVAVGFLTHQTSGCAASVGARFISTVERESLDFMANYVADWNRELVWAGGVLMRTTFEEEMAEIGRIWGKAGKEVEEGTRKEAEERALHLLKFFSFTRSTPQEIVGSLTESTFFATPNSTSTASLTLLSNLGPTPAHKLRLPSPQLSGFIKSIPTIPASLAQGAPQFLTVLRAKNLVKDISLDDVFADLAAHPLSVKEAVECFKWWTTLAASQGYSPRLLQRLKDTAMLSVPTLPPSSGGGKGASTLEEQDVRILPLGAFRTFVNPKTIPLDLPLPEHTLPFELSSRLPFGDMQRVFGWSELSLAEWVGYLLSPAMSGKGREETDLVRSAVFAEKALGVLAKAWHGTPATTQQTLTSLVADKPIIPTRSGQKKPGESYFPNVSLFPDLAVVELPSGAPVKGNWEKLLLALGVRKHVELQLVFTRLLGAGDWSHQQLVKYLVSVKDTLSPTERDRLRKTAFLPKEGEAKVEQPVGVDGVKPKPRTVRYRASELYEPTEALRELGLPVVDWTEATAKWRAGSEEAKLLFDLGLLRQPPVDAILDIAATAKDEQKREKALRYFLDGCVTMGYAKTYSPTKHALAFVPALDKDGHPTFAKPTEVFGNPDAALLGFPVLSPKYAAEESRFQLRRDPLSQDLVAALISKPPESVAEASKVFAYLSSMISHFSSSDIEALKWASFIPARKPDQVKYAPYPPLGLYFSTSDTTLPSGLKSLFQTVPDFGPAAKPFLIAVGVKESPSTVEIAQSLIANPSQFYDLAGSSERYLSVLRLVAVNYASLPSTLRSRMKMSAFFLGTKRISTDPTSSNGKTLLDADSDDDDEGGETTLVYQLARASDLAVNDEPAAFAVFQADILACPQEDALEALAEQLGAHRISKLITEHYRTTGELNGGSKRAVEVKRTVAERTFLFLSERRQQYGKGELKHEPDWINKHLKVHEVRSIELVRTLKSPQGLKKSTAVASACAQSASNGDVELLVSSSIETDFYEVALGLCKLLLSKVRPNDALLLLTILQTSLKALKRGGFQVDRLINARKAEREAAEQRMREERLQAQLKAAQALSPETLDAYTQELSTMFPDAAPDFLRDLIHMQDPPQLENAVNQMLQAPDYPKRREKQVPGALPPSTSQQSIAAHQQPQSSGGGGLFSNWRRQFSKGDTRSPSPLPPSPSLTPPVERPSTTEAVQRRPPGMMPGPRRPDSQPTSTDAIRANLTRAIQASRPETASNVSNSVEKTEVKEADSYCDATAAASLSFVAEVGGLRFFASKDMTDPTAFVAENHDALIRLTTQIVRPVGDVFGLDPRALHIFHDLEGPLIAFNRNGSIYINSRFYFAWHDKLVVEGRLEEPLISTFHTIAHEITHNLVKPHDTQFNFYFSSFCENYFLAMSELLQRKRIV
ncbi:hypothetical protein JCM11251_000508 [Rhodosporidiobolus azoricus]